MRRSLEDFDPAPTISSDSSPGVVIRPFQPGVDDRAWLTVNARAFADHPEQGSWTQADLDDRIAAEWFDPAGFLLAERGGQLLGYHWTKVHTDTVPPIGEVYVLGVDPAAQGLKLGKQLLAAGLRHLKERGLTTVLLYADASNTTAVQLYEKVGFSVFSTDTQYARL
jgi:mycothiol synthase